MNHYNCNYNTPRIIHDTRDGRARMPQIKRKSRTLSTYIYTGIPIALRIRYSAEIRSASPFPQMKQRAAYPRHENPTLGQSTSSADLTLLLLRWWLLLLLLLLLPLLLLLDLRIYQAGRYTASCLVQHKLLSVCDTNESCRRCPD